MEQSFVSHILSVRRHNVGWWATFEEIRRILLKRRFVFLAIEEQSHNVSEQNLGKQKNVTKLYMDIA